MTGKHLLSIKDLSTEEIFTLLDRAEHWSKQDSQLDTALRNAVICNLFFEASTRTRFSFEVAAKKLGSHVLNFYPNSSSTQKGETLYDTLKTLEAMGTNIVIIRHSENHILDELAEKLKLSIINAGIGSRAHPTQALLDLLTMKQEFGRIEGLKVAIIGDINHSRVAASNIVALHKMGAQVMLSGPAQWLPDASTLNSSTKLCSVNDAVAEADVVMMLRVQLERHSQDSRQSISELQQNYLNEYGLSQERAKLMKDSSVIMHPAPFNRGVEIDGSLVESPRSLIYKQVNNGVAMRMAILERAIK